MEDQKWQVDVKIQIEKSNGKMASIIERYLVDAISATDAEAKIYKEFEGESDFSVERVAKSRIVKVIL